MNPLLLLLLAYLLGATPTSLWVGRRVYGVDLRSAGSGNLGASNALRVLGWKAAVPVLLLDVFKGWLPAWLFPRLAWDALAWEWTLAYGAAAIFGHVYSVWVRFRGGKGVATSAGVLLAVAPWAALAAAAAWLAVVAFTRIVSLGSIVAALVLPLAVAFVPHRGGSVLLGFAAALAVFVVWAHRANLVRLARGEEHRFVRGGPPRPLGAAGEGSESAGGSESAAEKGRRA